jgi:hypothetical protein
MRASWTYAAAYWLVACGSDSKPPSAEAAGDAGQTGTTGVGGSSMSGGEASSSAGAGTGATDLAGAAGDGPQPHRRLSVEISYGCALRRSGELSCWGTPTGGFTLDDLPSGPFTKVDVGQYFVCGLRTDSLLACTGLAQLLDDLPSTTEFSTFDALETGCGVTVAGAISCWGAMGNGIRSVPAGKFLDISIGRYRGCAIDEAGALVCWGSLRGVELPSGQFSQVSEAVGHGCAIRSDGSLTCWREPGDGADTTDPFDDDWGQADPPDGRFLQVSAGWAHTCAIAEDHHVVCWGAGAQQGACDSSRLDECGMTLAPAGTFDEVAASAYYTCGIETGGGVVCWGTPGSAVPPTDLEET